MLAALVLTRLIHTVVQAALIKRGHMDRTTMNFLMQFGSAIIWVVMLILYAHLIPVLRSMGTALLAGASVASVVIGLAAQSTLGNLVAGISITTYRPFRLGDTLQFAAPSGQDIGVVELISLGYTTLRAADGHMIALPNSIAASQVTLNLRGNYAPWPLTITLRLSRDADVEAVRDLAVQVARADANEQADSAASSPRSMPAPSRSNCDCRRRMRKRAISCVSQLLNDLSRRLVEAGVGTAGADLPSFA